MHKKELLEQHPWFQIAVWPFIETGYRLPLNSYRACLKSLFSLHNELMNCWTHILGALWFIYLLNATIAGYMR